MRTGTGKQAESTRTSQRFTLFCDLSILYEGQTQAVPVRVPDISTKGMFINTMRRFPEGAVLKIKFRLPKSNYEVHTRGEVRYWLEDVGIGVEFVDLPEEAMNAIERELGPGREERRGDISIE